MQRIIIGLLSVCLFGSLTVLANEKSTCEKPAVKEIAVEKAATEQEMPKDVTLKDITATGKLCKNTKHEKVSYEITEADGGSTIVLVSKAGKEVDAASVDLEKWVGKEVKLVGKGLTKLSKEGKTMKAFQTVTSVEAAPEAAAPATAPEATPAAK